MRSFADLGVNAPLVTALAREGITNPFPIQQLTIPDALAGRDVCGKAHTGSGKTLAFALPLVQRIERGEHHAPSSLVLAPTRELARQIVEVMRPLVSASNLRVEALYGGIAIEPQIAALRRRVDIAVATPGRLIDLVQREAVRLDQIRSVVVDEADRMADMGFLPQVEWVLRHVRDRRPQMLLFSATLDGQIDVLVRRYLHDPVHHEVASDSPTVDDMVHRFLAVHEMDRIRVLASIVRSASRTLAFVRTKRGADRLAVHLKREGVGAAAIHGDLRQNARERSLQRFTDGNLEVLVATDVAARGLHIDDVDVVVHFDPPADHKAYLHRSGRTARAGRTGTVATFVLWNQVLEVEDLQRRLRIAEPIVEVFSNDPRLANLADFATPPPTPARAAS